MKHQSVVIIGGGVGGLFTGAFLAKNGLTVTVLEKNPIYGGGLQCFSRKGKVFETGMHIMGGFEADGILSKICSYLDILDDLKIRHIPASCMDEIIYGTDGYNYRIASGKNGFIDSLSSYFPEERKGIEKYVESLFSLTEELPLFYLKENTDNIQEHSEMFTWPADKFIAHFVTDEKLRELLAYLNPLYAGAKGHTPAYIHALINVLFIKGASRFEGGSQQLADSLVKVIKQYGGQVLCNKEVSELGVTDKSISCVKTVDGECFVGDWYISSIHPAILSRLIQPGVFRRGFIKRLNEIPNSYSAFSLYIDLKPDVFPYIDHTCYFMEDYGMMWDQDKVNVNGSQKAFMFMTPPEINQGKYASRLLVHSVMNFDEVRQWSDTCVGKRGKDYQVWKKDIADKIIRQLESLYTDMRDMIEDIHTSSPLTIRDFFNTKDGAMFGYSKDCENMILSHLPVYTKAKNLLMSGQNVNLHGICGVPLTAIHTAEAILGNNSLVKAINEAYETK